MDSDRELARVWRVQRTCYEMLRDRGYEVADGEISMGFEDFKSGKGNDANAVRSGLVLTAHKTDDKGIPDSICVVFAPEKNISKGVIKTFITTVDSHHAKKGILIYTDKFSSIASKAMQEMQPEYALEHFKEGDLLVNITRHFLVPKHTIMAPEEKLALMKKYRLKETQLPRIKHDDPVARYYGMRRGQVMKIERKSETAGRYITYRICM